MCTRGGNGGTGDIRDTANMLMLEFTLIEFLVRKQFSQSALILSCMYCYLFLITVCHYSLVEFEVSIVHFMFRSTSLIFFFFFTFVCVYMHSRFPWNE